jgi:hypothetical protein
MNRGPIRVRVGYPQIDHDAAMPLLRSRARKRYCRAFARRRGLANSCRYSMMAIGFAVSSMDGGSANFAAALETMEQKNCSSTTPRVVVEEQRHLYHRSIGEHMSEPVPLWLTNVENIGRDVGALIVFALMVAGVVALFYAGFKKVIEDKPTSATAAMSFGFLLIVMLTVSQFKHVKGFGFDAETWDQKQVEAAKLVDQLQGLTKATTRELALVASKIGLWDNGPSNQELMGIINTLTPVLKASGFEKEQRDELLSPIQDRIAFNYLVRASSEIFGLFKLQYNVTESNPCQSIRELPSPAKEYRQQLCILVGRIYSKSAASVDDILSLAQEYPADNKEELIKHLLEIKKESDYFANYRQLLSSASDQKK